jgi:hypothetical protein
VSTTAEQPKLEVLVQLVEDDSVADPRAVAAQWVGRM